MKDINRLRYAQLSEDQVRGLAEEHESVVIATDLAGYVGDKSNVPFFRKSLENFRKSFSRLSCGREFIAAYVLWCNDPNRQAKRNFVTAESQIKNGWVAFLLSSGKSEILTREVTRAIVDDFIGWLRNGEKNGKNFSMQTQRRYYGMVRMLFEEMRKDPFIKGQISKNLSFPNHPFPLANRSAKPAQPIDDVTLVTLLRACRAEIMETMREFGKMRAVIAGKKPFPPDETRTGRRKFDEIEACLWRLKDYAVPIIPILPDLLKLDPDLGNAVTYTHRMHNVILPFYPSPDRLIPFVLLQALYTSGNTGPLLGITLRQITYKDVMGVRRIVYRFVKARARSQYLRSFAVQDEDPLSPARLYEFLLEWTSRIRKHAGDYANNLFIFVTSERIVRGFLTGARSGADSDLCWKHSLEKFLDRHHLPKMTLGNLRVTGLDIIRSLSGDDIRAVQAAGGQQSEQVIHDHYTGAGTILRRQEALVEVMTTMEGWISTRGNMDPRGNPDYSDMLAATPGWHCVDPFDSPVPGEIKGRRCQAFGHCPVCIFSAVNTRSGYSLARILQLLDEIKAAREYLDAERWNAVYRDIQHALEHKWLPAFKQTEVWEVAGKLTLNAIGRLE